MGFSRLSDDATQNIISFLSGSNQARLSSVSSAFCRIASNPHSWHVRCTRANLRYLSNSDWKLTFAAHFTLRRPICPSDKAGVIFACRTHADSKAHLIKVSSGVSRSGRIDAPYSVHTDSIRPGGYPSPSPSGCMFASSDFADRIIHISPSIYCPRGKKTFTWITDWTIKNKRLVAASTSSEPNPPPFYFSWSPDCTRVVMLGSIGAGIVVRCIDYLPVIRGAFGTPTFQLPSSQAVALHTIAHGAPFFLSWSPDSTCFVYHTQMTQIGLCRFTSPPSDGDDAADDNVSNCVELTQLKDANGDVVHGGAFQAPCWLRNNLVVVVRSWPDTPSKQQAVVCIDMESKESFTLDMDGPVASHTFRLLFGSPPQSSHSFVAVCTSLGGNNSVGTVQVFDASQTGSCSSSSSSSSSQQRLIKVLSRPSLPLGFSPNGRYFLMLDISTISAVVLDCVTKAEWKFRRVLPNPYFLDSQVPFIDQYAQSHSPWSSDSSRFVIVGEQDEERGVYMGSVPSSENFCPDDSSLLPMHRVAGAHPDSNAVWLQAHPLEA